jgi:hypothetical protein
MLNSSVFETVFGLTFIFYAVAVICSGMVEAWANLMKKRSKYLLRGLRDLLDGTSGDPLPDDAGAGHEQGRLGRMLKAEPMAEQKLYTDALSPSAELKGDTTPAGSPAPTQAGTDGSSSPTPVLSQLMAHPLISPYKHTSSKGEVRRNPSYLPGPVFAKAMIDLAVEPYHASGTQGLTMTRRGVGTGEGPFAQVLAALIKTADGSLDKLQTSLESWFDGQMDRVSGSYKRWAKRWVIPIAITVAFAFNIDTLSVSRSLYTDSGVRAAVLAAASSDELCRPVAGGQPTPSDCVPDKIEDLEQLQLPVGWTDSRWQQTTSSVSAFSLKLIGLLLTAAAAALGAPFWFDALNRIGSLRNVGRRPSESS